MVIVRRIPVKAKALTHFRNDAASRGASVELRASSSVRFHPTSEDRMVDAVSRPLRTDNPVESTKSLRVMVKLGLDRLEVVTKLFIGTIEQL